MLCVYQYTMFVVMFYLDAELQTCPNRRAARRGELDRYDDCDRCGSERHKANVSSQCIALSICAKLCAGMPDIMAPL